MNEDLLDKIVRRVTREVLNELRPTDRTYGRFDEKTHSDHHEWIERRRLGIAASKTRRERIIDYIIGGAGLVGLLAIVGHFGTLILESLRGGSTGG